MRINLTKVCKVHWQQHTVAPIHQSHRAKKVRNLRMGDTGEVNPNQEIRESPVAQTEMLTICLNPSLVVF